MARNHDLANHTHTTALAPGVFFYHHIAKTAGTSWSVDIAKVGGLSHCGTAHLVGPDSVDRLSRSIVTGSDAQSRATPTRLEPSRPSVLPPIAPAQEG